MQSTSGGTPRQAVGAALLCYTIWAFMPLIFIAMTRTGASSLEVVGQRAIWSAPWAALLVFAAGQGRQALAAFSQPRVLGWLAISTTLLTSNWLTFVWASTHGHNIDASLGYYLIPVMNMAAGKLLFGEPMDRWGYIAMVLAAVGVALQFIAVGRVPWIGLVLAFSFGSYGMVRKHVSIDAQAGLLVESLMIAAPGLGYTVWLYLTGQGVFGHGWGPSLLLSAAGPATVIPLALFAWAARRLPLATLGFLQFFGPTTGFFLGLWLGEPLKFGQIVSFGFIWAGAVVFMWGVFTVSRRAASAPR